MVIERPCAALGGHPAPPPDHHRRLDRIARGHSAVHAGGGEHCRKGRSSCPGLISICPAHVWDAMDDAMTAEDHPQYRFRALDELDRLRHRMTSKHGPTMTPVHPAAQPPGFACRCAPRPSPDQWLAEGPDLGDLHNATEGLTLVEAASPRAEAETIALRLRQAAEDGHTAALISPDRMLTRQVTAALDRWDIKPDDSAGMPLALSPPGRFLRHVADLFGKPLTGEALLTLLKHPLCHSERDDRGDHLLPHPRSGTAPAPLRATISHRRRSVRLGPRMARERETWGAWLADLVTGLRNHWRKPLADHLHAHLTLAEQLAAGPDTDGAGGLWQEAAGREARKHLR